MPDALRIDDQVMDFSLLTAGNDIVDDGLLIVVIFLGKQDVLGAVGNAAPQGNVTRIAAITSMILQRS